MMMVIDNSKCKQCDRCYEECPVGAINRKDNGRDIFYEIDIDECMECENCSACCQYDAISEREDKAKGEVEGEEDEINEKKSTVEELQIQLQEANSTIKVLESGTALFKAELDKYKELGSIQKIKEAFEILKHNDFVWKDDDDHISLIEITREKTIDKLKSDKEKLEAYQKFGSLEEVAEINKIAEDSLRRNAILKRIIDAIQKIVDMKDLF